MKVLRPYAWAWALACMLVLSGCAGTRNAVDNQRAAEANASLGADFLRKNENPEALSRFKRALSYDNDNVAANWGMAVVNQRLEETDRARHYYKKTLDLQPTPEIYNSYAAFLCQQGEVDEAVKYFKRAAKDPRYSAAPAAMANAGLCLHRDGRIAAAEQYYRNALAADSSQVTALTNMARLQYEQKDYLRARAFLERADAATDLDAGQLLLGARIELALGDRGAASAYLKRHNASEPSAALSLSQLEQSR